MDHTIDLSYKLHKIIIAAMVLIAIFFAGQWFIQAQRLPQNAPHEIQVYGEGKAYAKPDVAIVSFGARTEAPKSQDAVAQNNKIMDEVISAIKKLGVQDNDIQTTIYNLEPVYEYSSREIQLIYPPRSGNQVVRGYSLNQQIQVKIRKFENINAIMDAATSNGANTVGQLHFTVDDMEKVRSQAREKAIVQAKEKAKSIFAAGGLRVSKLINISEGNYGYTGPMYARSMEAKDADTPSSNIQVGENEVNIIVTLTYRIR